MQWKTMVWQSTTYIYLLAIFAALASTCSAHAAEVPATTAQPVIVAYVFPQNHELASDQIAANKVTRINYAFANLQNGRIASGFPLDAKNIATLVALKKQNPSLAVLVSVGGWTWSGNFSDAALTPSSRAIFAQSAIDMIEHYQLDGVDIDWEYPGQAGAGNRFRAEDKQNYTLFLKDIRSRFDEEEKKLHRHLFLTIAVGSTPEFLAHTEMGEVQKYVDTINLMAYDYYEPESDTTTGNHSPLFTDPADPKAISADRSVQEYEHAGVSAKKMVLGVPFYGHVWKDVPDHNHGLFQAGKAAATPYMQYSAISENLSKGIFQRYWDTAAAAPYLYSAAQKVFVSYEDVQSLIRKCQYVREHGLSGMMFWEYSGDPSGALLDAIDSGLLRDVRQNPALK